MRQGRGRCKEIKVCMREGRGRCKEIKVCMREGRGRWTGCVSPPILFKDRYVTSLE